MGFKLLYHPDVKKRDLSKIRKKDKELIRRAIEERLTTHPEIYGRPLRATLKGFWKLRIGDYRVVFKVVGDEIHILAITHRKDVYQKAKRRIA